MDPTPRRLDPTPRRLDPTPRRLDPTPRRLDPTPRRLQARDVEHDIAPLSNATRLAAIDRLRLLSGPQDEIFDRASRLASRLLGTPVALVSIVTDQAQHFVGATGLSGEVDERRTTPLSHSFCQHVVRGDGPLAVVDAERDPLVADNLAIPGLQVHAYLGVPLRDADGQVLGSFCVIDHAAREWTSEELELLDELSAFVRSELLLRDHLAVVERTARARDDLLRTVAHDLRAAVTAVVGALQTLDAHPEAPADRRDHLLQIAHRQAARIEGMMDALLDPARAAGLETAPTDLAALVRDTVAAATTSLGGRDRVDVDVPTLTVRTHAPALERALLNLVRNALQHTDGHVRLSADRQGDHVAITVADEGPGLPPWLLTSDLGDASLQGRSRGHGIGLFSALTLIRSLGGDLTVETGDSGTALTVLLPCAGEPADAGDADHRVPEDDVTARATG